MTETPKTIERTFEVDPGGERFELTPAIAGGLTAKLSKEAGTKSDVEDVTHTIVFEEVGRLVKVKVAGKLKAKSSS